MSYISKVARRVKFFYFILVVCICLISVNMNFVLANSLDTTNNISPQIITKKNVLITDIKTQGLQNYPQEIILRTISFKKGDELSKKKIRSDINKLYSLGFFSLIEVEATQVDEGVILTFIIKEKPKLHNIEFIGNVKFSEKELNEEIAKIPSDERIKLGTGYYEGKEKETKDALIDFYRSKGYFYIDIKTEKEFDETLNQIVLRFIIDEGTQKEVTIKEIKFIGNNSFSNYRLRRQMETKEYFFILEDGYYKENIFKGDLLKIIDYYKNKGYANAKILKHNIEFDKKKRMLITIEIYEGSQYKYGDIEIVGNAILSKDEIISLLNLKKDELYNQNEIKNAISAVTAKYGEKGYISSNIQYKTNFDEEKKYVFFSFSIIENIQYFLNEVKISGNDVTKDKVIRRELTLEPGDIFNTKKMQRSMQRVSNLGFFQNIEPDTEPGNREDNLNLRLKVKEKQTGQANFGMTYSDVDGLVGQIQVSKHNFFGYGQTLNLTWEFGKNLQNYEIGFTDPYIFDTRFLLGFNVFNTIRSRSGTDEFGVRDSNGEVSLEKRDVGYEYKKVGGGLNLGRALSENLRASISYNYEDGEYSTKNGLPLPQDVILGETATRSVTTVLVFDDRDNVFNPTTGAKYNFSWEKAGGFFNGDNNYNKFVLDTFWYYKTFSKFVLMLHSQVGTVDQYGSSEDVPPIEKFSLGGGSTVRGYAERDVADRKKRELYFNLEHGYPVDDNVNFITFIDSGNAWDKTEQIRLKDLRSSFGLGLHLETPIGPLRFDYGWGLNLKPGDDFGRFHFNLGWGFY